MGILCAGVLGDSVAVAKMSAAGSGPLIETGNWELPTAYCNWQPATAASSTAKRELKFDETNRQGFSHRGADEKSGLDEAASPRDGGTRRHWKGHGGNREGR